VARLLAFDWLCFIPMYEESLEQINTTIFSFEPIWLVDQVLSISKLS